MGRKTLGTNRCAVVEAIRGDTGWSTLKKIIGNGVLAYKPKLEKMEVSGWSRKVYEWNKQNSSWVWMYIRMEKKLVC